MMHGIAERSRDNARTPMQWDGSKYAGFTAPDAATEPWISVNPNHVEINAAAQCDDPESVHAFYKQLIDLRHRNPVVAAGDFRLLDASDRQVYSFVRALSSKDGQVAKTTSRHGQCLGRDCTYSVGNSGLASPRCRRIPYRHNNARFSSHQTFAYEA